MKALIERLLISKNILVLTGAGISADTGIPTFRGKDGIWHKVDITQLATPTAFKNNPQKVWDFYRARREKCFATEPGISHLTLVELENLLSADITIITQNVDGLHIRAGSKNVIEIHGSLSKDRCNSCGYKQDTTLTSELCFCPKCDELMRPDIVWFEEQLDWDKLEISQELSKNCDTMFVIGTSALVYPSAGFPIIAKQGDAFLVEINPEETPLTRYCDMVFRENSSNALEQIVNKLKQSLKGDKK